MYSSRDPAMFPQPELFEPERWLQGDIAAQKAEREQHESLHRLRSMEYSVLRNSQLTMSAVSLRWSCSYLSLHSSCISSQACRIHSTARLWK